MRLGHVVGLLFTLACLVGLYLAWPYVTAWLGGTWLADLELVVLVVFVTLALSGFHLLEVWVSERFARGKKGSSNH